MLVLLFFNGIIYFITHYFEYFMTDSIIFNLMIVHEIVSDMSRKTRNISNKNMFINFFI